ncbi:MAG: 3-deoxy-7-phosphoheptulonate synthase [Lachnospiraceae bacterium]|nr:3-deoxy-7-phosphoheptulonate synthase [Lachnospiraceae bacterium]
MLVSRDNHPADSVIKVNNTTVGGGNLTIIAGPCSVESEEQILNIARAVKENGATMLRGGAFKPRTSPYSFQGLGKEALNYLSIAKKETGLPVITEITDVRELELFDDIDVIQIGARNMQNFALLKEVGKSSKPVLLKRGYSSTYEEFLYSAEYIMAEGNENIILCERGIRTFEHYTRNTVDIACVPVIKKMSHLPILVDASHGTGKHELVEPLSLAAVAAGADGVMVEVHDNPDEALSDGSQSQTVARYAAMTAKLRKLHEMMKEI